jgi:Rps23 Pro-64 3,4-dihydroxylase Tpa1-like proline 4-hydroxylase
MNEISDGIVIVDNIFVDSMEYLVKLSQNNDLWSLAGIVDDQSSDQSYNKNHRDTDSLLLTDRGKQDNSLLGEFSKKFYESTNPVILDYIKKNNVTFGSFEKSQILRYGLGQKFDMHVDEHPTMPRKVSMIYYANEDYSGGEIEFPNFDLKIKPKANQMIIFPSSSEYAHRVHPVVSGTRFCVVQWIM